MLLNLGLRACHHLMRKVPGNLVLNGFLFSFLQPWKHLWRGGVNANCSRSTIKSKDVCVTIKTHHPCFWASVFCVQLRCVLCPRITKGEQILGAVNVSRWHVRNVLISRLNRDQYSCLYHWWLMWNLRLNSGGGWVVFLCLEWWKGDVFYQDRWMFVSSITVCS